LPTNDAILRTADREDVAGLLKVLPQITSRPNNPGGKTLGLEASREIFDQIQRHGNIRILVAEEPASGEILGALTLVIVPNLTYGGRPWAILENVVVVKERRGEGIGSRLLAYAHELSERAGCYKVQVISGPKEDQIHFYRKAGMVDENCCGFKRHFVER
jgi:GNAT superfamily N-acetyltransferase